MKILTIVIPMYNVQEYIEQCLQSFVIPEIMNKIEVLVIDDGSKDNSANIAKRYEEIYPEAYRVIHKENGGHGSTINIGISEAMGNYIKVVDGDDWVEQQGFRDLVCYLESTTVDLVMSQYCWVDYKTMKKSWEVDRLCKRAEFEKVYLSEDILADSFLKMHAMTFKTSILKNMPERLDEHCFYVDTEYMIFPLPYVNTVSFVDANVYMYRIGMDTQSMNLLNMQKRCDQHEKVLQRLLIYCRAHRGNINERAMIAAVARVVTSQYKIYLSFGHSRKKAMIQMDLMLKHNYKKIYDAVQNQAVCWIRRSGYCLFDVAAFAVRRSIK